MRKNIIGAALALSLVASSYAALTNGDKTDTVLTAKAANGGVQAAKPVAFAADNQHALWNGRFVLKHYGEGKKFTVNGKSYTGDKVSVYYTNLDGMAHANPNYVDRENIFLIVVDGKKYTIFNAKNPKFLA